MTVTVTALKRALEQTAPIMRADPDCSPDMVKAVQRIMHSPYALTILANRLSDRGAAGNAARRSNLIVLERLAEVEVLSAIAKDALQWAIDELTPPEMG